MDIKLNELIFKEIEPLLVYNCSFQRILELSLLSKSIFKRIQNQITNQQKEIKFKPEINQFLNYIYNFKNNDDNKFGSFSNPKINDQSTINESKNYQLKLIQYKEMEILNCINNHGSYNAKKNNEKLQINLKRICENLKKVYYSNYFPIDTLDQDPTCQDFYEFEKIEIYWDCDESPPESFYNECNDGEYLTFNYSFEFLNRFKSIKKISIRTCENESNLHLENLDNFLNILYKNHNDNGQLRKIEFNYHNTPYSFLINDQISNNKNLNSLSIRLGNFGLNIINNQEDEESEESEENEDNLNNKKKQKIDHINIKENINTEQLNQLINNNCDNTSKLIAIIFKNINLLNSNNSQLRKLCLNKCHSDDNQFNSPNSNDPSEFLKLLKNNNSLKILGLAVFDLIYENDYKLLSELINQNNINQLITNIQSFEQFLFHCNENKNIQILKISMDQYSDNFELLENMNWENISNLINNNNSLKSIYLYNNDQFNENIDLLNNLNYLIENNKNGNINIKIIKNFK